MVTMCKTAGGTLAAFRWNDGIACGIYGKGNCISLEYDKESGSVKLLMVDDLIKEQGVVVEHVDGKGFGY